MATKALGKAEPVRVLVVGQTPPPHVGQFIMIERMLRGEYDKVRLFHVRMAFSASVGEIGTLRLGKILHLFAIIGRIVAARFRHRIEVLYYPPAGPDLVPVCRDLVILLSTRWLFRRTVFHFHAGGVSELEPRLPWPLRFLFRRAYGGAEVGIRTAPENPPDSEALGLRHDVVVANGIDDVYRDFPRQNVPRPVPTVLSVGMLVESKGVLVLLEAARLLKERGIEHRVTLVGAFASEGFESRARGYVGAHGLEESVTFTGVLTGAEKWRAYAGADVFCFPTFYESETFGLVAVEAMQFALPVVATDWRGLPSIVEDGETGYLVPVRDADALADRLATLLGDAELRREMGETGRRRFLERYTAERYCRNLEEALCLAAEMPRCG